MLTILIFFILGVLMGASLSSHKWKSNLHGIQSVDGKYKVVPFEWFWAKTFKKDGEEFHQAMKEYNEYKDEM